MIISGGFSTALRQVLPELERSTGITVVTLSGASQGKGPETIAAQLGRGVSADVAILSREGLAELIAAGRIAAGTDVDLARAALAAAVRSGARKPDISIAEAFRQALVSAQGVAVPASTSGIYLTTDLFPRLGIADKFNTKIMPRGLAVRRAGRIPRCRHRRPADQRAPARAGARLCGPHPDGASVDPDFLPPRLSQDRKSLKHPGN